MKQLITRHYYTLEDLFNTSSDYSNKFKGPFSLSLVLETSILSFLYTLGGYPDSGEVDTKIDELWHTYLYPRFYNCFIGYVDVVEGDVTDEDILEDAQEWLGRVVAWLCATSKKYSQIIDLYETNAAKLMDKLGTEQTSLFNDTPQDGGDFATDNHTTTATKTSSAYDAGTPMSRLKEIRDNLDSLYQSWATEFRRFIMYGG